MSGAYVTIMDTMLMILVICALRFLLRPASARFRCLLWAIVPLRLLCPFVVPSIFSIYQVSDVARDTLFPPRSVQIPLNAMPASASTFPVDLWHIISVCGTVILLTWGAVQMIRLKHDLREAVPLKDDVWACDNAASPFIFGILHPRIYVPAEMEHERLDDVIAHEQAHIDHKDHWWKALAFVILAWRWSDAFMWLAFWLFARDLEERCDEEVISSMEQQQRGHYARSLLACSSAKGMSRGPLAFGEVNVKQRIKRIMLVRRPSRWITCGAVIAVSSAFICLLTIPDYSSRPGVSDRFDRITSQSSRFTAEEINDAMNIVAMDFHEHFDGCTLRSLTYDEAFNTERLAASGQDSQRTIILMSVFDVCEAGNAAKTLNNGSTYVDYPWVLSQDDAGRWHISGGGYG